MKMEKMYVAPEVEVLLMEVELGFAGSGVDPDGPQNEDGPLVP